MVLPARASVAAEVLAWAVHCEGIGVLHPVLAPAAVWRPRDTRGQVDELARAECARLGWLDRKSRMDVEVVASLAVLCRAGTEFYGWMHEGERTVGVLAAVIGREALLAIRDGDLVRLSRIGSGKLPDMLVAQAPDVPAGRIQPVRVPRAELVATTRAGRRRAETGVGTWPASPQARAVRHLGGLPELGTGELHVAVRDKVGRRGAAPEPLRYVDTSQGRYLYQVTDTGGDTYVLVAPATRADLVARLREMRRGLSA